MTESDNNPSSEIDALQSALEYARKACHGLYGTDQTAISVGTLCQLINALTPHGETPAPLRGEVEGDVKRAKEILARLCDQGLLRMSIPVRNDDEDMVLSRVINAALHTQPQPEPQGAGEPDMPNTFKRDGESEEAWLDRITGASKEASKPAAFRDENTGAMVLIDPPPSAEELAWRAQEASKPVADHLFTPIPAEDFAKACEVEPVAGVPVAWLVECGGDSHLIRHSANFPGVFAGAEYKKTPLYASPQPPKVEQEAKQNWAPYLSDQADGVRGHFAIARWNTRGYREVWNLRTHQWAAFSDEVLTRVEAEKMLESITFAPQSALGASGGVGSQREGLSDAEKGVVHAAIRDSVEVVHGPYLCIAPVCGETCDQCRCAISPQEMRDYARRYAWLRSDELEVPSSQRELNADLQRLPFREDQSDEVLFGKELDAAIDANILAAAGGARQ